MYQTCLFLSYHQGKKIKDNQSEDERDSNISEKKEAKESGLKRESTMSLDVSGQSGKL